MNPRDMLLLSLRRQELDYQMRAREALIHVEEALRKNELQVKYLYSIAGVLLFIWQF